MDERELRAHRCCFTGHRPEKLNVCESEAKALLRAAILEAIDDSFVTFISGGCRGIDLWAAQCVLEQREKNSALRLVCALPMRAFESRWSEKEQKLYRSVLAAADAVRFVCERYSPSCFQLRNVWMVDRSARVIAAYNGEKGGTRNTLDYARRQGLEIRNILER